MSKAIFQRYLASAPAIALDAVSQRMLHTLAQQWATGVPLTVMQAMVILPEISTTTAHRKLKELHKKALINLDKDARDSRIKYVVSTKLSDKYFENLGKAIINAVVGEPS